MQEAAAVYRAPYDGRIIQQPRERLQIQGGGHHQDAHFLAQVELALDAQGESEIGVQAALVKLIEDDTGDALQGGILLQHAGKDALGDHLDARARADARIEPSAIAHVAADRLAAQLRHAGGDGACRQAARFEHQYLAAEPRRAADRQGHDGALAGPRRRLQQHAPPPCQRVGQRRQRGVDGQIGQREAHRPTKILLPDLRHVLLVLGHGGRRKMVNCAASGL